MTAAARATMRMIGETVEALDSLGWQDIIDSGPEEKAMTRVTGSIITVQRKSGPVLYIKARDRNGKQIKKRARPGSGLAGAQGGRRQAGVPCRPRAGPRTAPPRGSRSGRLPGTGCVTSSTRRTGRSPTVTDYRNTTNGSILKHFGKDTPLVSIDTDAVDEFRRVLLERVSKRTAQKTLVLLTGLLGYAKRRRWILENPAEFAEKVSVTNTGEFNVLEPEQVHAVSRGAESELLGALFTVAGLHRPALSR